MVVEVICSDKTQHRHRIEARNPDTRASNWLEIINREFDAVDHATVVIDTAGQTVELAALSAQAQQTTGRARFAGRHHHHHRKTNFRRLIYAEDAHASSQ